MTRYVRVGTTNNFNCTCREWAQLDKFTAEHPDDVFFVNCNAKTPLLHTINSHNYKAVITVNPDLKVSKELLYKVLSLDPSKIAFVRVKWVPSNLGSYRDSISHRQFWPASEDIAFAIMILRMARIPVVITAQRFNSKKTLRENAPPDAYTFSCSRYRLSGVAWKSLLSFARKTGSKICDKRGLGCQGCHQCATLNGGKTTDQVVSLNLSTSGVCPYNCVDCYAKAMQRFVTAVGNSPIEYDRIKANNKQRGVTKHIQHAKAA